MEPLVSSIKLPNPKRPETGEDAQGRGAGDQVPRRQAGRGEEVLVRGSRGGGGEGEEVDVADGSFDQQQRRGDGQLLHLCQPLHASRQA